MPAITALLHTKNDALRLGRTLETLFPCSDILVVDHESTDDSRRIARQYGAIIEAGDAQSPSHDFESHFFDSHFLEGVRQNWILCLQPGEILNEDLQASLFEWASLAMDAVADSVAFSVSLRQQTADGNWMDSDAPETRLIPRHWDRMRGHLPVNEPSATILAGKLCRFALP